MDTKKLKDHRQIGQELDLFSVHEVAPGAIFWHHKGWVIYRTLVDFIRSQIEKDGYQEISTPVMVKSALFRRSGHWEHFGEHNMFNLSVWEDEEISDLIGLVEDELGRTLKDGEYGPRNVPIVYKGEELRARVESVKKKGGSLETTGISLPVNYSLKPMNCPEASLVYSTRTRSYQDLPIRYAEFGILHRRELSGVLGGLLRVRQFTIDDAHHFVRPDQIQQEILELLSLISNFYKNFGFEPHFYLATKPEKAMGEKKLWTEAEKDLEAALKTAKVKYDIKEKDGAFYGPKIDIHIKDSQGRDWQLATIQLDFQIPEKMELEYIDTDGKPKRPVIVHRAILGSIERFIGIILEHYQGNLPLWLAPVQVAVLPISDKVEDYSRRVYELIKKSGLRVELDMSDKPVGAKIREATLQKIPFMCIIGEKEKVQSNREAFVSVRTLDGEDLSIQKVNSFIERLKEDIEKVQ